MDFSRFLISDIFSEPTVLVSLITLIGLIAQKKSVTEHIKDTVKITMGFVVLSVGAGLVVSSLSDFANTPQHASSIQGVVPNNEAIVSVAQKSFRKKMAVIMLFAMAINIMIARFTPRKFIFLTGRRALFMPMMVAVIPATAGMTGIMFTVIGSLAASVAMVFFPATAHPYMKEVAGSDDVAIGYFSTLSYVLAGFIDSKFGSKKHSTEDMNVPKGLLFLCGMPVAISFIMSIAFLMTCPFVGADVVEELNDGKNWFMFSVMQSITFVAGVYIILQGARIVIAGVVPTFKGISDKLAPNARPALDYPVVSPYTPNAVLVSFLSSFAADLIGMFTLYLLNMIVTVPGVMPHFFVGVAAGVFGNATSGRRGAISGTFAQGLLTIFPPIFLLLVLGDIGFANTAFSDADFGVLGILLGTIVR